MNANGSLTSEYLLSMQQVYKIKGERHERYIVKENRK